MDVKRVVTDPGPTTAFGTAAKQVLRIDIPQEEVHKFLRWLGKHDATEKYSFLLSARLDLT
jgi:hypothetical protein